MRYYRTPLPNFAWLLIAVSVAVSSSSRAEELITRTQYDGMVSKAIAFLSSRQAEDGSFSKELGTGVTSLAVTSLIQNGRSTVDPVVAKGIKYVLSNVQPDGGIYKTGTLYRNYETCLAILCLASANDDGRYDAAIKAADKFVKGLQWDEEEGKDRSDPAFGGGGYGSHKRPDLSNTTFLIEALKAAGNEADSDAIQRALIFVSRCQNLESEHNNTPFASKNEDGGLYYTPAAGGSSQAGTTANGGLRSYGSMTYAGLKSMIYAGLGSEDKRVKAATEWIRKHYDLKSNPGMGLAGLFYYYHTFAKALDVLGQDEFQDAEGKVHHWRLELATELYRTQHENGSWINKQERWLEGNPDLVTGYALMALSYCRPN